MSEWQPIETAKKDGTIIDVWLGDASQADVDFYCTPGTRRSPGWRWQGDKWRPQSNSLLIPTFVQPTHWMPLPGGPEGTGYASGEQAAYDAGHSDGYEEGYSQGRNEAPTPRD